MRRITTKRRAESLTTLSPEITLAIKELEKTTERVAVLTFAHCHVVRCEQCANAKTARLEARARLVELIATR